MNCPHCHKPIDEALLIKERNASVAKQARPGARGLVRNPAGRGKPLNKEDTALGVALMAPALRAIAGKKGNHHG